MEFEKIDNFNVNLNCHRNKALQKKSFWAVDFLPRKSGNPLQR